MLDRINMLQSRLVFPLDVMKLFLCEISHHNWGLGFFTTFSQYCSYITLLVSDGSIQLRYG